MRHGGDGARRGGGLRTWRADDEGLTRVVAGGGADYDRRRTLPRLIAFDPRDLRDEPALGRAIRARLMRSLRAERRRGRSGHWAYDLNRHLALLQALAGEDAISEDRPIGTRASAAPPSPEPALR